MDRRRMMVAAAPWAVLVVAVAGWVGLVAHDPGTYWRQTDMSVYRDAGRAVPDGARLYGDARFGTPPLRFTYPPLAALLFAAVSGLPPAAWKLLLAGASLVALLVVARGSAVLAGQRRVWPAAAVLAAVGLWLEPVDLTLHFGQVNLLLAALVVADLARPDGARGKGVGVGLAAAVKLTPLIFVAFLLFSGRRRAAATAAATFAASIALAAAALPRDSVRYWGGQFAQAGDVQHRLVNQSLFGVIARLTHDGGATRPLWLVTALVAGAAGLAAGVVASRRGEELWAVVLVGVTGLLVSPVSWTHHWVWIVPALALALRYRPALPAVVAGAAVFAWWPLPVSVTGGLGSVGWHPSGLVRIAPHEDGRELHWSPWQSVYGNAYVLVGLAFVAASAAVLLRRRQAATRAPTPSELRSSQIAAK